MANPHATYDVRCPVHGFITLNDLEWEVINQPAFQRLRRIRQLAWTDYVYPGAMHTRFEHSLGVMHMATMLYDGVVRNSQELLESEFGYNEEGLRRDKALVRLTALLHDVGHAPFSHAGEDLLPSRPGSSERYGHEHYSAAIIRKCFGDVIKNHRLNRNYGFTADDIADLIESKPEAKSAIIWRELIAGQIDADRMDYLLRDSLHAGVSYGRYDWNRLVNTVRIGLVKRKDQSSTPRFGVSDDGMHAAEALILARYFMFTQVYFHKTRVAYDYHIHEALRKLVPNKEFPSPANVEDYLKWDDWRVLGFLAEGKGGEHGLRIRSRNHHRRVWETPDTPSSEDLQTLQKCKESLGKLLATEQLAEKSTYKAGPTDIPIFMTTSNSLKPLSEYSAVIGGLKPIRKSLLYVASENVEEARKKLEVVNPV